MGRSLNRDTMKFYCRRQEDMHSCGDSKITLWMHLIQPSNLRHDCPSSPPLQFSQGEKMRDIVKRNGIYVFSSFVNLTPWLQFFINNVQVWYMVKKMPILLHRRGKKLTFYDDLYRSRKDWHTGFRYAHAGFRYAHASRLSRNVTLRYNGATVCVYIYVSQLYSKLVQSCYSTLNNLE
jgi:hypothetical protein